MIPMNRLIVGSEDSRQLTVHGQKGGQWIIRPDMTVRVSRIRNYLSIYISDATISFPMFGSVSIFRLREFDRLRCSDRFRCFKVGSCVPTGFDNLASCAVFRQVSIGFRYFERFRCSDRYRCFEWFRCSDRFRCSGRFRCSDCIDVSVGCQTNWRLYSLQLFKFPIFLPSEYLIFRI